MKRLVLILCMLGAVPGQTANEETVAWRQRRNDLMKAGKTEQDMRTNAAMKAWHAYKTLPGLPSLNRPVRVKVGSYICNTGGELLNPNVDVLLFMHECTVTSHTILAHVLQPTNMNDYVTDYYNEIVEISYRSGNVADGKFFTAWVPISVLSNSVAPR